MKWLYLILFSLVALVSQMLWLNFAALINFLKLQYGVEEDIAMLLILVFPLFYVLLSVNAGAMIDKKGYKPVITFGLILMCIGAIMRIFNDSFWMLFAGQCVIAIAQPYIINGISKLVADWFPEKDAAGAVGIGTAFMFIGMAMGIALTPGLVGEDGAGFNSMLIIMAAITIVCSLLFILIVKSNPNSNTNIISTGGLKDYGALLKNKNIVILSIISFISLGFFNGITGCLEQIQATYGINAEDSGMVGGMLIIGGIFGAAIVPVISDKIKKRKVILILAAIGATLLAYPVMTRTDMTILYFLAGLLGFVFLPGYAILLTSSEEEAGKQKAGASTGLIMLFGNAGGLVVIPVMAMLSSDGKDWVNAIYFCVGILAIAFVLSLFMKETFKKTA
jgi:predicted MFS family arabinose efflux permease